MPTASVMLLSTPEISYSFLQRNTLTRTARVNVSNFQHSHNAIIKEHRGVHRVNRKHEQQHLPRAYSKEFFGVHNFKSSCMM